MSIGRTYFVIAGHYTIGDEFPTYDEALAEAHSRVKLIEGCSGTYTREFVDERLQDSDGDRIIKRVEVLPDGSVVPA